MEIFRTFHLDDSDEGIAAAVSLLTSGGVVAFPTETVYGLGADARSSTGLRRIFKAKGRPRFNPLILHVSSMEMVGQLAIVNENAIALANGFWPGPLTLLMTARSDARINPIANAGLTTVAIRFPSNQLAQRLIDKVGYAVAAPSANRSGRTSTTSCQAVLAQLDGVIDAVIDGGPCDHGLESTIVDVTAKPTILRYGAIEPERIEACIGKVDLPASRGVITAPGQLVSHYAPTAKVQLNVRSPNEEDVWIGFGDKCVGCHFSLSPSGNLEEAARNLYLVMTSADSVASANGTIAFAPVPDHGLGKAINDRLRRASAPPIDGIA